MPTTPRAPIDHRTAAAVERGLIGEIRDVYQGIRRRWLWVAIAATAALIAAVLFLMAVTPRYIATAQILIDPRAKRIVEGAVVPGGYGSSAAGADTLLVDSQVELIQSNAVLKKIVEAEQLQNDGEFAVPRSSGGLRMLLRNTIGRALFGNDKEVAPATNDIDTAVWRFADRHLRVRRLGNTYVINVSVMSRDAAKAARLANAVAQAYITDQVRATGDTTREATSALQSRIEDLRKRVETTENAVETFRTKAGLIGSPNLLVTEQQLQQTNDKLILARSQTALAKARFDQVKELSARGSAAALGAQSDALKSPVIANLRAGLSRVERREAIVQQTLRPGHPEYANVMVEKRALLAQIEDELSRIKANARAEYDLSQGNEKAIAAELKTLESQTAASNQAQVRLRELQREAQAARTIFEQFLNRAKETSEQENFGRENSRIISEATVPPYPAFPPTLPVLLGALLAGLGTGAAIAWLAHTLAGSPGAAGQPARPGQATGLTGQEVPPRPPRTRQRLRTMLAPMAPSPIHPPTGPAAATGAPVAPEPDAGLETIARLPLPGTPPTTDPAAPGTARSVRTAVGPASFADHIAAVDDASDVANPGYRAAIDNIIATLRAATPRSKPTVALLVGTEADAGTASTALAIAYRAAVTGQRTLLVDVAAADPRLSHVFAANLQQRRACVLDSEAHLAEITLRDERTGLSILPMALANLAALDADQQRRLLAGLRQLSQRFDLVVMDAGPASANTSMAFLAAMADKVLITAPTSVASNGLMRLRAIDAARRFRGRSATASVIEISAG